ncbi:MAG: hypothetical protein A4E45_01427 [Methanosaeta sp. PtaB.Bin039]|nr:MAG: hypothetical protein A4E45_01427 [Methanosaeta sp. PtaB.Bin039]
MYFRLNPECYLIKGRKLGAIFDLIDGTTYALDHGETELINNCENNIQIDKDNDTLKELKCIRLGNFYDNKIYVPKLKVGSPFVKDDPLVPLYPPEIHRAFLEINNSCDRECWYCGYHGVKRSLGCMGCNKWENNDEPLGIERWREAINELEDLDCREIIITGGDLALAWDKTVEILNHAVGRFRQIYLIMHQESLSSEKMDHLEDKATLIVQTERPDSTKSNHLRYLVVVKSNEHKSKIKEDNTIYDYIIAEENSISKEHPLTSKKKLSGVNMFKFLSHVEYHPCLGHSLTICNNGDVTPCPMMRNHCFGNIRDKPLYSIFEDSWERINQFWKLNLDRIEKCTGCEFRYSCSDCRALEERLTGKIDGKALCNYNPREGIWT